MPILDTGRVRYFLALVGCFCGLLGASRLIENLANNLLSSATLISFGFVLCGIALLLRLSKHYRLSALLAFTVEVFAIVHMFMFPFALAEDRGVFSVSGLAGMGVSLSFLLCGIAIQFLGYYHVFRIRSFFVGMCGTTVFGYGLISMAIAVAGLGQESLLQCLGLTGIGAYLITAAWFDRTRNAFPVGFSVAVAIGGVTANIVLWQGLTQSSSGASPGAVATAVFYSGLLAVACLTVAAHFAQKAHSHALAMDSLNQELLIAYDATLTGWARALSLRDMETHLHTARVTDLSVKLAREFKCSENEIVHIKRGAQLHDVGKIGIPDSILLKPGPLDDEEWVIMRRHPTYAYELLKNIQYLCPALDIPMYHHEKWDGTGYPYGLSGNDIPFAARMFAVIDVWDALCSDRPYRRAMPAVEVSEHLRSKSKTHFDPTVVDKFLALMEKESDGCMAG